MQKKIFILFFFLMTTFTQALVFASQQEQVKTSSINEQITDPAKIQKVIDEYKEYVSKVQPQVRDEIINYRKEIAKINKQKKSLYSKLSQESQDYLKHEQEYKKRLPLSKKKFINIDKPGEKPQKSTN